MRHTLSTMRSKIFDFLFLGRALYQLTRFWHFLQNVLFLELFTWNFQAALHVLHHQPWPRPPGEARSQKVSASAERRRGSGIQAQPSSNCSVNVSRVSHHDPQILVSDESLCLCPSPSLTIFSPDATSSTCSLSATCYLLPVLPNHQIAFL